MLSFAEQLDQMMGKHRNLTEEEKKTQKPDHFSDSQYCKHYLVDFCPHVLFNGTKYDLGPCPNEHDDSMKAEWDRANQREKEKYSFKADYLKELEVHMGDMDRRIARLSRVNEVRNEPPPLDAALQSRVDEINEKQKVVIKEIEELGEEGKVDEAEAKMKELEALRKEKEDVHRGPGPGGSGLQPMQEKGVCEICGAFLVISGPVDGGPAFRGGPLPPDTKDRPENKDHYKGKLHVGFEKVRAKVEELRKELGDKPLRSDRDEGRSERKRERSRSRERKRDDRGRDRRDRSDRDRSDRDRRGARGDRGRKRDGDRDRDRRRDDRGRRDRDRARDR